MKLILKPLRAYVGFVNRLVDVTGYFVSWLTTALVLVVCYDVLTRYLLNRSMPAVQELEWHLFALIFLLGAACTLKHDKHVRVDVLYSRLSAGKKAWINLLGSLVWLIPFTIIVLWTSSKFAINSFTIREMSPDPGGLPAWYILKAAIPVGFFLLFLQGVSLAFSSIIRILEKNTTGPGGRETYTV